MPWVSILLPSIAFTAALLGACDPGIPSSPMPSPMPAADLTAISGPAARLVAYWPMDADTIDGSTLRDIVGGDSGAVVGGTLQAGKHGEALSFSAGKVSLAAAPSLPGAFTVAAWVRVDTLTVSRYQVVYYDGQRALRVESGEDGGFFAGLIYTAGGRSDPRVISTTAPAQAGWQHVVFSWDGAELRMYVNGQLEGRTARIGSLGKQGVALLVNDGLGNPLLGALDEVRLFTGMLTSFEVAELFEQVPSRPMASESR